MALTDKQEMFCREYLIDLNATQAANRAIMTPDMLACNAVGGFSRDVYAQNALKRHVYNPPAETSNQPYVWLKIISPNDITEGPFMVTSWEDEAPHDDVATWSIEASSAGQVDVRDVGAVITITTQPQNRTLTVGDALNLSVAANVSDSSTLTYQWKKGGTDISGATNATYTKASVVAGDAGSYSCQVTSSTAGSVTSSPATVTVNAA